MEMATGGHTEGPSSPGVANSMGHIVVGQTNTDGKFFQFLTAWSSGTCQPRGDIYA